MATETVAVTFRDSIDARNRNTPGHELKRYAYLSTISGLKKGDKVVVDTQYGYAVATYEGLASSEEAKFANTFLIVKIDPNRINQLREDYEAEKELDEMVQREVYKATRFAQAKEFARNGNQEIRDMLDKMGIEWKVENGS